jgi:hypothetical protein
MEKNVNSNMGRPSIKLDFNQLDFYFISNHTLTIPNCGAASHYAFGTMGSSLR